MDENKGMAWGHQTFTSSGNHSPDRKRTYMCSNCLMQLYTARSAAYDRDRCFTNPAPYFKIRSSLSFEKKNHFLVDPHLRLQVHPAKRHMRPPQPREPNNVSVVCVCAFILQVLRSIRHSLFGNIIA